MKKMMLVLIGMIVMQLSMFAQREIKSVNNAEKMQERKETMKQERDAQLNLTKEQSAQMDQINEAYREKMMAQRNTEREDRRSHVHTLNEWRTEEVRQVLDDEQFAAWQEMQIQRQERAQGAMEKKKQERVREGKRDTRNRPGIQRRTPRGN